VERETAGELTDSEVSSLYRAARVASLCLPARLGSNKTLATGERTHVAWPACGHVFRRAPRRRRDHYPMVSRVLRQVLRHPAALGQAAKGKAATGSGSIAKSWHGSLLSDYFEQAVGKVKRFKRIALLREDRENFASLVALACAVILYQIRPHG